MNEVISKTKQVNGNNLLEIRQEIPTAGNELFAFTIMEAENEGNFLTITIRQKYGRGQMREAKMQLKINEAASLMNFISQNIPNS